MASLADLEKQYSGQGGTSLADLEQQYGVSARPKAGLSPQAVDVANDFLWSQQGIPEVERDIEQSLYEATGRIDPAMMPTPTAVQQPQFGATAAPQPNQLRGQEPGWMVEIRNALERGGLKLAASVPGTAAALLATPKGPAWSPYQVIRYAGVESEGLQQTSDKLKDIAKTIYSDADREAIRARKGGVAGYIVNTTFETLPMMAMSTVAAIPGGAIGAAGAFSVAALGEGEAAYQEAMKAMESRTDLTLEQKEAIAQTERLIVGTINGMIEKMQADEVLTFAKGGKKYVKDMVKAIKQRAWAKVAASGAKIEGVHLIKATSEGFEEFLQEGVGIGAATMHGDKVEIGDLGRMFKAGVGGFTAGYGLTAGGAIGQTAVEAAGRYDQQRQDTKRTKKIKTAYDQAKVKTGVEPGRPTPYEDDQETTAPEIGTGGQGFTPTVQPRLATADEMVEKLAGDGYKLEDLEAAVERAAVDEETKAKLDALFSEKTAQAKPEDADEAKGKTEAKTEDTVEDRAPVDVGEKKAEGQGEVTPEADESGRPSEKFKAALERTANYTWTDDKDRLRFGGYTWPTLTVPGGHVRIAVDDAPIYVHNRSVRLGDPTTVDPGKLTLQGLVVDPEFRGKGLGSKALVELQAAADASGITLVAEPTKMEAFAPKGTKALSSKQLADWYKRHGWVQQTPNSDLILEYRPKAKAKSPADAYGKALEDRAKQETDEVLDYRGGVRRYVTGQQDNIPQAPLDMPEDQKREIIRQEQEKADEKGKLIRTLFGRMPTAKKGKQKPLEPQPPKVVESTQETANEPRTEDVDEAARTEGQSGVPGVPPARSAEGRGPADTGPGQQPTVEGGARTPEQDVSGPEPATKKIEEFRRDHMNERGEIVATDPDQDPTIDFPSAQGGFVGGRPGRAAARAQLSAIVKEDMKTGSKAADDFLRRNRGYTINVEAPGALRTLARRTAGFAKGFHFLPYLPKTEAFAEVREAFRHSMEIAKKATTDAAEAMKWALQPIKGTKIEVRKRYDALVMKLQADSLMEDIEKGVALPPDMTEADVEAMKAEADRLYAKYPSVRQAYDRLREKTVEVTDMLVDMGWLARAQAKEFYFPHKVIKYLQQNQGFFGVGRKPAVPRKGYLKQRKGGHDYAIDLDYMVDHWAQVRRDVAMTKFLEKTLKAEQDKHFKSEYPDWKQGDPIPAGFKEVTVLPGRFYYKAHGVSEDLAMALVNQDLAMIEAILDEKQQNGINAVRTALAVGKKRSFIVREQVADQVYDMPTAAIASGDTSLSHIYNAIKAGNTFIKRQILFNPLYFVPFHTTNFIGDAHKVLVAAPGALKSKGMVGYWTAILAAHDGRKPKLFDEAQEYGVIGSGWIGVDVKSLKALLPEIEKAEISGASAVATAKAKRLFNLVKTAGESREDWLRYATFAYLCELQDKGKDITRFATKDTKVVRGLKGHEQAAKIARDILGDYSAIGKSGVILADLAMPFYRWMHLNLPWWPRLIKEYGRRGNAGRATAALLAALAPYIAAMLWNYSDDDRRKFEEKLPPWKRWTFHIVGVHGKKLYYIPLPLDDLVQFFGVDNSLADFTAYQKGIIDLRTLAYRIAANTVTEPGMGIVNAVGGELGVIRDAFGIKTFPEFADYRIKDWDRRAMNVAKDIFGAPAQLVEAVRRENSAKTHDLLWRSVLPIRPWTPTGDPMDALASRTYRDDQEARPLNPEQWRAHKGKQVEVDRIKAQVAGESPEDLRQWHLQDRARRAKERIERRRQLLKERHGE